MSPAPPCLSNVKCQFVPALVFRFCFRFPVSGVGPSVGVGRCWSPPRYDVVEWIVDRSVESFRLWAVSMSAPLFTHFSGTPVQVTYGTDTAHCSGECLTKTKKAKVKVTDRNFEVHGGAVVRTSCGQERFPTEQVLNWKTLLSRRAAPVSSSLSVWRFYRRAHTTNTTAPYFLPPKRRALSRPAPRYTITRRIPNSPSTSLLRSGWTVDKETLDF